MHALRLVAFAFFVALIAPTAQADVLRGEPPADETTPVTPSATPEPAKPRATPEPAKPAPDAPTTTSAASSGSCAYGTLALNSFGAVVVFGALFVALGRRRARQSARA